MLSRIFIQNFALIDTLEIHLQNGLQVITGETGAGKSIILGALRLIMGDRADVKSIQNTESKSIVETEFQIRETLKPFFDENDLDFENPTIVRREILPSGKSRAFVNDVPVTLDILKSLTENLIDIHSQFETSQLFSESYQFGIIDGLSENKNLISDYQNVFNELRTLEQQLKSAEEKLRANEKESDYKTYLLQELEEAKLDDIHWEDLQDTLRMQENAEVIGENLSVIFQRTDQEESGILDSLLDIRNRLSKMSALSHQFSEISERFEGIFVDFKDLIFELQNKAEHIGTDAEKLQILQEKINKINALLLKHQKSDISELIDLRNQLSEEQAGFSDLEERINVLKKSIAEAENHLHKRSVILAKNRKKASDIFAGKMQELLQQLGLEKAKIEVELTDSDSYNRYGKQNIQILFQANSGFPLKPIQTAISGGERSRVMLAVKKIMAENSDLPTLILDEIDSGVSGRIAQEIGTVMQEMAKNMQLIVITHLAQVAAKGSSNYKVLKEDVDGKTRSTIISLSSEEKLQEIAQLLSGNTITEAALQQAKELMR